MADKNPAPTIEQLQEEIARLKTASAELEARALASEKALEKAAESGKPVLKKVKGKATITVQTIDGPVEKTVGFNDGNTKVRTLAGDVVSSEAVLTIANGGKASADDILKYPALSSLEKDQALAILTHLVTIEATSIKIS